MQRAHAHGQSGFTLVELLMSIGVLGVLSAIVIVALNPSKHLLSAYDAMRRYSAGQLENAIKQYGIAHSEYPQEALIPLRECEAVPVCAEGVTTDEGCLNLDAELAPLFIAAVPQDPREPNPSYSGYKIYRTGTAVEVIPMHLGEQNPFSTISAELIARWAFDDETGTAVPDVTGCGNNGTLMDHLGATAAASLNTEDVPTVGFVNPRALDLSGNSINGPGNWVAVPNSADFSQWQAGHTISLWVKPRGGHFFDRIIEKGGNSEWYINFDDVGDAQVYFNEGSEWDPFYVGPSAPIEPQDGWHHLAAVFSPSPTHHLSMYIDGVLDSDMALPTYTTPPLGNIGDISIGACGAGPSPAGLCLGGPTVYSMTNASLDDIRIYTRALSVPEIEMIADGQG